MEEEIQKVIDEWKKEVSKIKIELPPNTLSNIANKPYWDLEKKYRQKIKQIKEKYERENNND